MNPQRLLNRFTRLLGLVLGLLLALPLVATQRAAAAPADFEVDRYGQVADATWPGKVTSDAELRRDARTENRFYDSLPKAKTDIFGGDARTPLKLKLERTGYFHIENVQGKSVLVDPRGNQFFSLGLNVVSVGDTYTHVAGREDTYEYLPPATGDPLSPGWMTSEPGNYSFYIANQIRKYGSWNADDFWERTTDRMRNMGFNTVGGFSDIRQDVARMPYVAHLDQVPDYKVNGIYDVYRPGLQAELDAAMAKQIGTLKNDQYLIGYMFFNEINWANLRGGVSQATASETSSKKALVDVLRARHGNDIAKFNAAWGMEAASFDELLTTSFTPSTDAAVADVDVFTEQYLNRFYKTFTRAIRKADPNHMVMGDRWFGKVMDDAKLRRQLSTAAGKYLDVITYNYYAWDPSNERLSEMYRYSKGVPFMITEFHYGEPSHGLNFAINMAEDEDDKGKLYRHYVEKVAASGMVVGAHWFEYLDQAATGRWFQGFDGEAGAIGMVDVADRPYKTLIKHVAKTNSSIYQVMNGTQKPFKYTFSANQGDRQSDQTTVIPKAAAPLAIDGQLEAGWPTGPTLNLTNSDLTSGVALAGVEGNFRLAWDAENLYLHAAITDPTPMMNTRHGFDIWDGDAIELFVGGSNVDQGGGIQVSDNQIIISAQPQDAQGTAEYYWYNGRANQPKINAVVKPAEGGYTVEAAIPLAALGVDASTIPKQLRFDVGFDDGNGRNRQRQYLWNGVESNAANREKWGRAWLVNTASDPLPGQDQGKNPKFVVNDTLLRPGEYLRVTARGLRPGEQLPVRIDGERLATLVADADGKASAWVRVPSLAKAGRHKLTVDRGTTTLYTSTLTVVRSW